MFSTLSLKNLPKSENLHFQLLRTFVFDLKLAVKPVYIMLPMAKPKFKPF